MRGIRDVRFRRLVLVLPKYSRLSNGILRELRVSKFENVSRKKQRYHVASYISGKEAKRHTYVKWIRDQTGAYERPA